MKKKTKILITLFLSLTILFSISLSSFASEGENAIESIASDENEVPNGTADAASKDKESRGEENPEAKEHTIDAAKDESIFGELYAFALENADKIFSCLAFIGAVILSFAYKKGLFPFVEKALSSLTGAVKQLREESEKSAFQNDEHIKALTEKLKISEAFLSSAEEKLSCLEAEMKSATALADKTEELRRVVLAEVEMIYGIFISSSLPQDQKDRVGEAYSKMKEMLKEKEG